MSKKVLFATDFSKSSDDALDFAADVAKSRQATLLIVHVVEPPYTSGYPDLFYTLLGPDEEALRAELVKVRPNDASVVCEHRLLVGRPARMVVDLAKDENAEMIVIGSHGRTGIGRALLGSVAEGIVRHATCPVLVVKNPHAIHAPVEEVCPAL